MTVTVLVHCDHCATLKQCVAPRKHIGYYPSRWEVAMTSCEGCFETAKRAAQALASEASLVCMSTVVPTAVNAFKRGWNDAAMGRPFDLARFPSVEYCAGYQDSIASRSTSENPVGAKS